MELFSRRIDQANEEIGEAVDRISKALTSADTPGFFTTLYGAIADSCINNSQSFMNFISFQDRTGIDADTFGVRIHTARNTTAAYFTEGAAFSGSEGSQTVKTYTTQYENYKFESKMSGLFQAGIQAPDALQNTWDDELVRGIDDLIDVLESTSFGKTAYSAGNTIENLNRIVGNSGTTSSLPYSLTRSADAGDDWMDCSSHMSGSATKRDLQMSHIKQIIREIESTCGKRPNGFLTTYALRDAMEAVYRTYISQPVPTMELATGWVLKSIEGIPVLPSQHCYDDSETNKTSTIYAINRDNLKMRFIKKPGQASMIGMRMDNVTGDYEKMMGVLYPQLVCTNFRAQGKMADMQ